VVEQFTIDRFYKVPDNIFNNFYNIFNSCYNLVSFPEYFWGEDVYVDRAVNIAKTIQIYKDPNYIDHPPLGWIILLLLFSAVGFP